MLHVSREPRVLGGDCMKGALHMDPSATTLTTSSLSWFLGTSMAPAPRKDFLLHTSGQWMSRFIRTGSLCYESLNRVVSSTSLSLFRWLPRDCCFLGVLPRLAWKEERVNGQTGPFPKGGGQVSRICCVKDPRNGVHYMARSS